MNGCRNWVLGTAIINPLSNMICSWKQEHLQEQLLLVINLLEVFLGWERPEQNQNGQIGSGFFSSNILEVTGNDRSAGAAAYRIVFMVPFFTNDGKRYPREHHYHHKQITDELKKIKLSSTYFGLLSVEISSETSLASIGRRLCCQEKQLPGCQIWYTYLYIKMYYSR